MITFNVWGANQHLEAVENWLREQNVDVVLLQEVPPSWIRGGLRTLQDVYPYQLNGSAELGYWGNALLSRFPIMSDEDIGVTAEGVPAYQRVLINVDGRTIAFYNVHTLMPVSDPPHFVLPINNGFVNLVLKYNPAQRDAQIEELISAVQEEAYPFIVGGDFNMSDQAALYEKLAISMGDSFREAGYGYGTSWPIADVAGLPSFLPPLVRIDYLWHSQHFQAINAYQGPRLYSDHLPLYASFS